MSSPGGCSTAVSGMMPAFETAVSGMLSDFFIAVACMLSAFKTAVSSRNVSKCDDWHRLK